MTTVCKLGGSLITAKDGDGSIATDALDRIARTIDAGGWSDLVLVHGGGSFGHRAAEEHRVSTSSGTHDPIAIRAVTRAMDDLNDAVVDALLDADVPAVAQPPRSAAVKDGDDVRLATDAIGAYLAEGLVPVLHGELVPTRGSGATVLSGDALAVAVARALDGDRIGLCTGVPGVLDDAGTVIPHVGARDEVAAYLDDPEGTDVTGGMAAKVDALLGAGVEGAIFGLEDLQAFLDGEMPGTVVDGSVGDTGPF